MPAQPPFSAEPRLRAQIPILGCVNQLAYASDRPASMAAFIGVPSRSAAIMDLFDAIIESSKAGVRKPDPRIYLMMCELLEIDGSRKQYFAMMSGLDIRYDLGEGHALLVRRMPDLDFITADGSLRVFTLLYDARPVLLNLGAPGGIDIMPWADRVQLIDADYVGVGELPAIGVVAAPTAVLIRPDGYVAWLGDRTQQGLADALTTWFGPPKAP